MARPTVGSRVVLCLLSVLLQGCGGSTSNDSPVPASAPDGSDSPIDAPTEAPNAGACPPCVPDEMTCTQTFPDGSQAESTTWVVVDRTEIGCSWQDHFVPSSIYTLQCASMQICVPTGECFQAVYESDGGEWGTLGTWGVDKCYVKT
jgi:hypothetical protein